jgi:hypothetical protein
MEKIATPQMGNQKNLLEAMNCRNIDPCYGINPQKCGIHLPSHQPQKG